MLCALSESGDETAGEEEFATFGDAVTPAVAELDVTGEEFEPVDFDGLQKIQEKKNLIFFFILCYIT